MLKYALFFYFAHRPFAQSLQLHIAGSEISVVCELTILLVRLFCVRKERLSQIMCIFAANRDSFCIHWQ